MLFRLLNILHLFSFFSFPWYIAGSSSLNEFFIQHQNDFSLVFLLHEPESIKMFAEKIKQSVEDILKPLLPICLAYLLPGYAKVPGLSDTYQEKGAKVNEILRRVLKQDFLSDYTLQVQILENLFLNMYDPEVTKDWFAHEIFVIKEDHFVTYSTLKASLEHFKESFENASSFTFISYLCAKESYKIEKLMLNLKLKIHRSPITEQKIIHLFQYCALVDLTVEYLTDSEEDESKGSKEFLIRDICYFLCNILVETDLEMMRKIVTNYLKIFFEKIVGSCATFIQNYFDFIVSCLLSIYEKNPNSEAANKSVGILKLLVVDNREALKESISRLSNFPKCPELEDEQMVLTQSKYEEDKKFNLADEIKHVIRMKNVKYEGLVTLKNVLSLQKGELIKLYEELSKTRGFSEDCEKSILHKLIIVLLDQIKNYTGK